MKKINTIKIVDPSIQSLLRLGFSKDEAKSYLALVKNSSLTASEIARKLSILPSAVYRLIAKLEDKGFVISLGTYPATFQAIPQSIALDTYVTHVQKDVEEMKAQDDDKPVLKISSRAPTSVDVVVSQKAFFSKFVELADQTKEEILIISIGEPVPDEIKIACVRAKERGVVLKFIFHVHNKENDELLKSWVKMGMDVRHYKDSGYHLTIADGKVAVLVANNPQNTMDRIGMVYYNERLANSLRDYFYRIWEHSTPILVK